MAATSAASSTSPTSSRPPPAAVLRPVLTSPCIAPLPYQPTSDSARRQPRRVFICSDPSSKSASPAPEITSAGPILRARADRRLRRLLVQQGIERSGIVGVDDDADLVLDGVGRVRRVGVDLGEVVHPANEGDAGAAPLPAGATAGAARALRTGSARRSTAAT